MDEWLLRELIGRAIRGWAESLEIGDDVMDDGNVMSLASHISDTLRNHTELPILYLIPFHSGTLSGFGQPPILP